MVRKVIASLVVVIAGLIIIFDAIEQTPPTQADSQTAPQNVPAQPGTTSPGALSRLPEQLAQANLPRSGNDLDQPDRATLSVGGIGKVTAVPDIGMIQIGVVTENPVASTALSENSAGMSDLFTALETRGVADRDVQTTNLSINPIFSRPGRPRDGELQQAPRIIGYRVENRVSIKVRDLDNFGAILDDLVASGANTIHGIRFAVDEPQALLDEALAAAIKDARRKADIMATAGGFTVGTILQVRDNSAGGFPPPQPGIASFRSAEASVPIAEGEMTFRVNVSVSYKIVGQ